MMWKLVYNILFVPSLWLSFKVLALFNRKVRRGWEGRKNLFLTTGEKIAKLPETSLRIWFHSASLGEFEQAKPIITELKKKYPEIQVIVSFFSPSGYEHSLSYRAADVIMYLPFDSRKNARRFMDLVKPSAMILVRYDIWPNHIWEAKRYGARLFILSATLRKRIYRKLPVLRQFVRSIYNSFDFILTVSDDDKEAFGRFGLTQPEVEIIGDSRYDQVWTRSSESRKRELLDSRIVRGKKVVVIGSSWPEDEEKIIPALVRLHSRIENLLVIIVPHEPTEEHLENLEKRFNGQFKFIRFSYLHQYRDEEIIVVDSVGILVSLYQYAHVAYVGGSFGSGVHNVLEPAAYGIPIIFGPRHMNSYEPGYLISQGAAFVATSSDEIYDKILMLLSDEEKRKLCGTNALSIVQRNTGATQRFLSYMEKGVMMKEKHKPKS